MTEWDRYYMNLYKVEPEMDDVDNAINKAMVTVVASVVGSLLGGIAWLIWKFAT